MDAWIADTEEVFAARVREPAAWTGASIGAWLMLRIHGRHPEWFRAMCALAPAFDWDQAYVGPRLADGRLGVIDGTVVNPDATALATRELLVSMAAHHVLREPATLAAPLHVIFGGRDEMAPPPPRCNSSRRREGRSAPVSCCPMPITAWPSSIRPGAAALPGVASRAAWRAS
jgi:pimeloyl-ACP methyl ester carboxylesterase